MNSIAFESQIEALPARATKSEETRALILNTALALFRERGFERTTMREVATAAGVALGSSYYHFASKDALVLAYYERAQQELEPILRTEIARHSGLEARLRALLKAKKDYFAPNRALLSTLAAHTDPDHSLSPFGPATKAIRERDIYFFRVALMADGKKYPADLMEHLPGALWMYQMGIILFWVFDRSAGQRRTTRLLGKSLPMVTRLIQLSTLPLMRPMRKMAVELLQSFSQDEEAADETLAPKRDFEEAEEVEGAGADEVARADEATGADERAIAEEL